MAFTLNRRLSTLVDSNGQLNTGKIPNDYITSDHVADNTITTAMLHTGFTLPTSSLSSIDTDNITEGSTNLFYTDARVDSRLSGGTGVTYSSGTISIGQAVATSDSPTFADLTVTGNLNITGDINSYNVTDLDVTDQTITLGAGQIESNSGGSGIIIDGSNASILWDETNDQFDFNKGINIDSNTLVVDGTNNRVGILNAAPDVSLDIGSSTDAIHMPVGTTAQRPSSPAAGYFRYNSDDGQFEGYTTEWGAIAGSGGSAMETNNFTGDGSTTAFTLSSTVASEDNLIVFIEGIYQNKGDYVASGTTITFTTAPVNGRRIVVQHIKSSVAGNSTLYTSLSGDGSTTAFTLSGAPGHENNTQVFMDGVYQQKDSYIVNGTTLTFDAAPANGSSIEVMSFAQTTINQPGSNTVSVAELNLSDGTSGQFITTDGNGTISFASVPAGYTDSDVETYLDGGTSTPILANATIGGMILHNSANGGSIGFNRNPANGNYIGNASLRRFQINGPDTTYGDFLQIQSYNSSGASQGNIDILDGKMGIGANPTVSLDVSSKTDAIRLPNGTEAQKPTAATGLMRYNTTTSKLEAYIDNEWKNVTATSQSLTGISGLDLWADVTGGISSTTIADLSGNNRTGTLSSTSHSGTLNGNTYMLFNASGTYLNYGDKPSGLGDYQGDVTFFFVLTNTSSFSSYRTLIGDSSGAAGYQIIRTNGSTDDWQFYLQHQQGKNATSTNTALNSGASISTTQILIFSFGSWASGNLTIYKRTGGVEGIDSYTGAFNSNLATWGFDANSSSNFWIGNSAWAYEYYDGGMFAWGIIDHEITSSEKQTIYDYYAAKNIGN